MPASQRPAWSAWRQLGADAWIATGQGVPFWGAGRALTCAREAAAGGGSAAGVGALFSAELGVACLPNLPAMMETGLSTLASTINDVAQRASAVAFCAAPCVVGPNRHEAMPQCVWGEGPH